MIQKKLQEKQENFEKLTNSIEEVKLLMDKDAREDTTLISNAFPRSANQLTFNATEQNQSIKKLSETYGSGVYTTQQIKEICMNYRLRFLPSTAYKGIVPIDVIHSLKRMLQKEGLTHLQSSSQMVYQGNIFVLAPASMFKIKSTKEKIQEQLAEARRLKEQDPALFIKLGDNKFLFVKEWGNSFSLARRVLGFFTATQKRLNWLFFSAWLIFVILGIKGFVEIMSHPSLQKNSPEGGFVFVGLLVYSTSFVVFTVSWLLSSENGFFMSRFKSTRRNWWKVHEDYATENNWNKTD